MTTRATKLFFLLAIGSLLFGPAVAGELEPPGPPAPTMVTLQQIYDKIGSGAGVPKTGQTLCYDVSGNVIDCTGTGQDGDSQTGVSVSPRFTDNADGTVKDNLTGLIWLKNANCFGQPAWTNALSNSNTLASGVCGLTDGSAAGAWRLPNVKELESLIDFGQFSPALPAGHPFSGVQSAFYWSSTTRVQAPTDALPTDLHFGHGASFPKLFGAYVWPVRGGQFGPAVAGELEPPGPPAPTMVTLQQIYDKIGSGVGVPKTGQTLCWDASGTVIDCTGTGQDGDLQMGVSVSPRFTDNADGTVKDNLTGLIWLKNANCFSYQTWTNALSNSNALASGVCGLTDGSVAGAWRLPNVKELQSLIDFGQMIPALPAGHPFSGVQAAYYSSTTCVYRTSSAWEMNLNFGYVGEDPFGKLSSGYVWPVRGGQ